MYQILCDNKLIYDLRDESLTAVDPVLELEVNSAGSLEFTFMPDHPYYNGYTKLKSVITVLQDGAEIWSGRVLTDNIDFFKRKSVTCEGELAYLNDSIQRPGEYHDITVRQFLELMINAHNSQVDASRQFKIGAVTVVDSNNSLYRYLNYDTTYEAIKDKLMDRLGGFIFVRKEGGVRYLDYLKDYPGSVNQVIEFGENLLDYSANYDASSVATAIIPLGAKLDESQFTSIEERLTIKSVNNNVDYVQNNDAVAKYGRIFAIQTWDDVTTASALLTKAKSYLASGQWEAMTLECTAIDLNLTDKDLQSLKVGYTARITSAPHGMDAIFPVYKKTINFEAPQNDTVTFSYGATETLSSLTNKGNAANADQFNQAYENTKTGYSNAIQSAKDNATALLTSALHGYVVFNDADNDGTPDEILIMDSADTKTATKVWRWNSNGLGYSSTGYKGPYGLAMTKDGSIVADFITSGTLSADRIYSGIIKSVDGKMTIDLDKSAITATGQNSSGRIGKATLTNARVSVFANSTDTAEVSVLGNTIDGNGVLALYDNATKNSVVTISANPGNGIKLFDDKNNMKGYIVKSNDNKGYMGIYGGNVTVNDGGLNIVDTTKGTAVNNAYINAAGDISGANVYSSGAVNAGKSFSLSDAAGGIYLGGVGYIGFQWKNIKTVDGSNAMVLCHVY